MLLVVMLGTVLWILISICAGLLFAQIVSLNEHEEETVERPLYPLPTKPSAASRRLAAVRDRVA